MTQQPPRPSAGKRALFARGSWTETARIAALLRGETVGGALLLAATVVALVWANSPWSNAYDALSEFRIGPSALGLNLPLETWAADGLLAIFFFVVGLELKREFVAGDLRDPARAALPIAAAVGGMLTPALIFVLVNLRTGDGALAGWAIPTATDIAFAVAVLAVVSTHLPSSLRTFLLTLAVVDDLLAIAVIAIFYTDDLDVAMLGAALIPLALFTLAVQKKVRSWWVLLPLAGATWVLVHESGIHATVAGVLLGFAVPVIRSPAAGGPDAGPGLAEHFERRIRPVSAGFAVPVFAFFAAGVTVGGISGLTNALTDSVALGIIAGLVVGKTVGVFGTTYILARFTRAVLDEGLSWIDVFGVAILAGIGFTVSLLIGDLAYGAGSLRDDHVKIGVLAGSVLAALLASIVLRLRNRAYRIIAENEARDDDGDGIPDVYQSTD
ncbi:MULTISPECIES: Na+/H+ antiporter NhaA [Rhodococcus erythropolis group]|uniref:Na(+)/H(+) antiporter NhaA n=1 Tax=Rhodococcus qingshengii TaxID=334542 RepID=A0A2A5J293_RHOSG|nr:MULTISPECIES: Na+/H+ antiporter NhaA [Rhodococcus erythropolis group]MBO8150573.1 Na+/H+ antiporter NhaA [Rhodococcus erythropolis]MDO1492820.1 Na+/H+ antiporter NhaA [Rhodococcus erythropolis]PCK23329.1 Na+/H+ antiporter NhaA [Rhodococcus qingshengii]GCB59533.1 Na(+)/H(+) antiporter NhaA [Rhodococcus erythropolis]